jgi:hypothetical protein
MTVSFAADIRPLFREGDIKCMQKAGVKLDDPAWMCVPANARLVYGELICRHHASRCTLGDRSRFTLQVVDG